MTNKDNSIVTPVQEFIFARHSKMVGRVLDQVEAALPEGNQCEKVKKLIQNILYDFRNEMLDLNVKNLSKTKQSS